MPIYEYVCEDCEAEFEALVTGERKAACPQCQSERLTKKFSAFAVSTHASSTATDASCPSCGDPRGPGACSMG